MNDKPFYIVGFMGTGKSTLFPLLREAGETVDLDQCIEAQIGMDIATYFNQFGESAFREVETEVLRQVDADFVLTGGGIIERPENMRWMRDHGTVLHLDLPFEICWERIKASDRPLVQKGRTKVKELYERRDASYREADESIDATQTPQNIAEYIIRLKERNV